MAADVPWLPETHEPTVILAVNHAGEKCPELGGLWPWGGFQRRQTTAESPRGRGPHQEISDLQKAGNDPYGFHAVSQHRCPKPPPRWACSGSPPQTPTGVLSSVHPPFGWHPRLSLQPSPYRAGPPDWPPTQLPWKPWPPAPGPPVINGDPSLITAGRPHMGQSDHYHSGSWVRRCEPRDDGNN